MSVLSEKIIKFATVLPSTEYGHIVKAFSLHSDY